MKQYEHKGVCIGIFEKFYKLFQNLLFDAHRRLGDIKTVVSYFLEIRQQVDEHQARIDAAFP